MNVINPPETIDVDPQLIMHIRFIERDTELASGLKPVRPILRANNLANILFIIFKPSSYRVTHFL